MSKNNSLFGLDENIVSAFSYVLGPVTGLLAYVFERENKTVRFHALQAIIFLGALGIVCWVANRIPIINWFGWLFNLAWLLCMLFLTWMAYRGAKFKVPVLGDIVEQQVDRP